MPATLAGSRSYYVAGCAALMTHHRLAILPGVTQYDINVSPKLAAAVAGFLDERSAVPAG